METYEVQGVHEQINDEFSGNAYLVNIFDGSKFIVNSEGNFNIGRDADSDLIIGEKIISRKHAVICNEGDKFFLIDLNSKNGTYINGKRIDANRRHVLDNLDIIEFSKIKYRFEMNSDEDERLDFEDINANLVNIYGKRKLFIETDENQQLIYFQSRIIQENEIDGLLNMTIIDHEGKSRIYYDIEEMESLSYKIKKYGALSKTDFISMLRYLLDSCKKAEEYLLSLSSFLLDPRIIFLNREEKKPYFVYLPVKNSKSYLERLKYFFINLDKGYLDPSAELLQIKILKALSNEGFSINELRHMLMEEDVLIETKNMNTSITDEKEAGEKNIKTNRLILNKLICKLNRKDIFLALQGILILLLGIIMFSKFFSTSQCIGLFIIILSVDFYIYYKYLLKSIKNER
ncbi:MAG: FHA domain-containing protein [Clostridiales bacterium]|nr:FHA domain-containing protein [Clostridiales bacterium]